MLARESRWNRLLEHEDPEVQSVAARLWMEESLRRLIPFTTDRTLFRFTESIERGSWVFDAPYVEINRDDRCFDVWSSVEGLLASGSLDEVAPVLVRALGAYFGGGESK